MTENQAVRAVVSRVPELMYRSFRCLKHPDRLRVFEALCNQGEATTKDVEFSTKLSMKEVNRSLRELERLNLARHLRKSPPVIKRALGTVRQGDWDEKFNLYSATPHGKTLRSFCTNYNPEKPNLGGTLDPKDVVESFATLDAEELNLMLNKFRDMYLLGAALVSLHYQKHESATSAWLSSCLDDRLSKDEVEKFLGDYTGRLVVARSVDRSILDRALIRVAKVVAGKDRVARRLSKASYSLTPEGKRIAVALADQFHPTELGVNEEYLRPEKIEADHGVLGQMIVERVAILAVLIGITAYSWWDLFRAFEYAPGDTLRLLGDGIGAVVGFLGCVLYGMFRLPTLLIRIAYWRKLRKKEAQKS